MSNSHLKKTGLLLIRRLERLSADSYWAHRASGVRGGLIRTYDSFLQNPTQYQHHLEDLISRAFELLEKAAREIPDFNEGQ